MGPSSFKLQLLSFRADVQICRGRTHNTGTGTTFLKPSVFLTPRTRAWSSSPLLLSIIIMSQGPDTNPGAVIVLTFRGRSVAVLRNQCFTYEVGHGRPYHVRVRAAPPTTLTTTVIALHAARV